MTVAARSRHGVAAPGLAHRPHSSPRALERFARVRSTHRRHDEGACFPAQVTDGLAMHMGPTCMQLHACNALYALHASQVADGLAMYVGNTY